MKLEIEFSEDESIDVITERARIRASNILTQYHASCQRHTLIVNTLMHEAMLKDDKTAFNRLNQEAEDIEASWVRLGVEF